MTEIPKEILRAQTAAILINVLMQGDNYVYGIIKDVKQASDGELELNETTLYTIFKRLEKNGIIASYWGDESQGGRRKYYRLTDPGRQKMQIAFDSWSKVDQIIQKLKEMKQENSTSNEANRGQAPPKAVK